MAHNKIRRGILVLLSMLLLTACGKKDGEPAPETARETAEYVMESLKALELEEVNRYTDNRIAVHRGLFGIPTGAEYRIFNELQQPGLIKGKRYRWNYRFAQRLMEDLEWEIKEVREQEEQAELVMEISNLDMGKVMGEYTVELLESMTDSEGFGLGQLMTEVKDFMQDKKRLISLMDAQKEEERCTVEVTVSAYWEEDRWKLQLTEDFINAFMGNIQAEDYSEGLERQIKELEEKYERKIEERIERFEEKLEKYFP